MEIDRREFVKLSAYLAGFTALNLTGCSRTLLSPPATETLEPFQDLLTPPSPFQDKTPAPSPAEALAPFQDEIATPTPKEPEWQIPITSEIIRHISNPNFFTTLKNDDRTIFTRQFDESLYQFQPNTLDSVKYSAMNNACGPACITTILRLYRYLQTGVVPDINIGNVITTLNNTSYQQNKKDLDFIEYNGTMRFAAVRAALEKFKDEDYPISTIPLKGITIPGVSQPSEIIPANKIPYVIEEANDKVLSKGGIIVAFVYKYNYGHFSLFGNMDFFPDSTHPRVMVIDPRGYKALSMSGGGHSGIVEQVSLLNYLENFPYKGTNYDGFFSVFGVVPNFTKKKDLLVE